MPMPGAGDSYFYEWYVGLKNVIKMLNPDSGIRCVVFQHDEYDTIDDVVVENTSGDIQICYQVKHNIETAATKSLTFGSMLECSKEKKCLFEAMFQGWKKASSTSGFLIKPVLFSNRKIYNRRAGRCINGVSYSAYPVDKFVSKMQAVIAAAGTNKSLIFTDKVLECQWKELCSVLSSVDVNELVSFLSVFQINGNELNLEEMKRSLLTDLSNVFSCEDGVALELFGRLLVGLTEWTTTGRKSREVTIEDVCSVLAIGEDVDESQHRLAHPYPFFASRRSFCETLVKQIEETPRKVVFLSGDPGSGKTSTISYLQSEYNLFLLRYHTFRPISPEQHFYNADPGMCTTQNLWGTLLIQLRKRLKGHLAEYNVPVSNRLLSDEEMRSHVMRLLGILGQKAVAAGKKEYICIDGIDHAARAKIPVTFLSSLPLPNEIPDGVCFILAGQPATMYQDQYPPWLSTNTDVECIGMPKLGVPDIKQLIVARASQFADTADELANLVFQKTEGNNLSTVFAVEEIRPLETLDAVVTKLQQSCIGGDIQQYYNHIWTHMKAELSKILPGTLFPESIVACPLLLMNGRVNTRILGSAIGYGMGKLEWDMLLDRLFPLVIRIDDNGEYALFHNDFRVFLMGIIYSYQARYEAIALSLAEYLLQNNEGILSYVMGIQLLQCAKKEELIPQYFTAEFVINALAEGISKTRLDEFAHLSYDTACKNRDYIGYRNTYLAVKTLHQHKQYYEYFAKEYHYKDYPGISSIDMSEIQSLPVKSENLDEFGKMLAFCWKLYSSNQKEHKERALRLYDKWLHGLSPTAFVPLCADTVSEENAWELRSTETGAFLQHWGRTAAKLGITVPIIKEELSDCEWYAVVIFGKQYFTYCIEQKKYELAIDAIKADYVDQRAFAEKLEDIFYDGAACEFVDELDRVEPSKEKPWWNLMALAMKITCDPTFVPDRSVLESASTMNRIYDEACFTLILKAFLLGRIEKDSDDKILIDHSDGFCSEIEGDQEEKSQAVFMTRVAVLLGKHYWCNDPNSPLLEGYAEWLLSASLQRPLDYSKARRFLIYALLHSEVVQTIGTTESFIGALRVSLFEIDLLGMFYKSCILEYLVKQNQYDIIKEYIHAIYGENCSSISLEELKADMHDRFRPFGELVEPEMMQQFTAQLKWDVVGYLDYKEYALRAPLDCFEIIVNEDPSRWKDLGAQLYEQSQIAERSGNDVVHDIKDCLAKAAALCGIADYWEQRKWNDEFRLDPKRIYHSLFEFITNADSLEDLQAMWILSCGIHSWYTQSERYGAKCIYYACMNKALELDVDFALFVSKATPQWKKIVMHLSNDSNNKDYRNLHHTVVDRAAIDEQYSGLSVDESLDLLTTVEQTRWSADHYAVVLEKILACDEDISNLLDRFLRSFCIYLQGKEWRYEKYDLIMKPLLCKMSSEAFWAFAEANKSQLSDYDYQISTRNMQLLFKLYCHENLAEMEALFVEELETQKRWLTGNGHFELNYDRETAVIPFACVPQSFAEMTLYMLLEQADTQNARKLETAIYAIYLLGLYFPKIMSIMQEKWPFFSQSQEECLLPVITKWAADGICTPELHAFLLESYEVCSELSRKCYLHSILLKLHEPSVESNTISNTAPAISLELPHYGFADRRTCYENFLMLVERYTDKIDANAIRRYIANISQLENYKNDRFGTAGDSQIPVISELPGKIFYAKEKRGDWASIPLAQKKARLIPPEDPFILTKMPCMIFDNEWFPEVTVTYDGKTNHELSIQDLHAIAHSHVDEGEIVVSARLWYPWGHDDGTIYTKSSKIDWPIGLQRPGKFDFCLGSFGLLADEEGMDESCYTTFGTGGRSLFNLVCGSTKLDFGNCQLAPSSVWRDYFECRPKDNDPYIWVDSSGLDVLRFERIASPTREIMREAYIRQPILFRWVCHKSWLEGILRSEHLRLIPFATQEPYPCFGK